MSGDEECPSCGDMNASVEYGSICCQCHLQFGICKWCHTIIDEMVLWGWQEAEPIGLKPASLTDTERRVVTGTKFDEDEEQSFEEKEGYTWYRPPYVYVKDYQGNEYIDHTTIWVFRCHKCNKHTQAHCD